MVDIKNVKPQIEKLVKRYNLALLVLFGSQATGLTHKESDVDVAYYSHEKLDFNQEILLDTDLTGIFRNDKVSLINLKTASPLIAKEIVSKGVVLHTDDNFLFSQLYARVLRMYEEASPIFELRRQYLDYKIAKYRHV